MTKFENVAVIMKANVYYDGKVTSRTVEFENGENKTLGIMLPGEYTFNTDKAELMEILAGDAEVKLPGSDDWQKVNEGDTFTVPAKSAFAIKVNDVTDYICSFLD